MSLGDAAAFDRCLSRPPFVRSGPFALHLFRHALLADDGVPAMACWRLGLVIPKRYETSAVARNTIKRRWRDAFRRGRAAWAGEFGPADLVVRLQAPLMKKTDAPLPARVRARDRFAPDDTLTLMVTRLRGRKAPATDATKGDAARVGSTA